MDEKELISQCIENIRAFPTEENSRAYAWVDCNKAFADASLSDDALAKELFIFLASWGMLRGKAFLSAYNWRILRDAVKILKEVQKTLRNPDIATVMARLSDITDLYKRIDESLRPYHKGYEEKAVSPILVTKILIGALGCSVAYDTNVTVALEENKIATPKFCAESIGTLCDFYEKHSEFEAERVRIKSETGIDYPPMKIIDMALWQ